MNEIRPNNTQEPAKASGGAKAVIFCSFILIIPIFWWISKRNSLMRLQVKINETASDIDIQLKKRHDLLIKLLDSAKGYMKYEKSTLVDIVKNRTQQIDPKDFGKTEGAMNDFMSKFRLTVENYPELKANQTVLNLQSAAQNVENNISASRRFYNSTVNVYNAYLKTFPSNVVAASMHLNSKIFFEASESDRADVKIDFS